MNLNARDFSLAKKNSPTLALGDMGSACVKVFCFLALYAGHVELSKQYGLIPNGFLCAEECTIRFEEWPDEGMRNPSSDYSVFSPLFFIAFHEIFYAMFPFS